MLERINELEKQAKKILEEVAGIKEKASMVALSSLKPGDTFALCDRLFIVLEHDGDGTKVISKGFWGENKRFGSSKKYEVSSLKEFHEKEILPKIVSAVGPDNIIEHDVDLTALDGGNDFGKIRCKVRPLSFMEVRKYIKFLVDEALNDWWWTLTPWNSGGRGNKNAIAVVSPSGGISYYNYRYDGGVRPFCILKSNIFVSIK